MKSSEFRKVYASLRKPTVVTVNGHVLGQWIPEHSATYVMATLDAGTPDERHEVHGLTPPAFNTRPFTPVPKKGK